MRSIHANATTEQLQIGAQLRSARNTRHMTIDQLASATGLSRSFISRVENNSTSPSVASLVQLCKVLSISIGDLFAEAETELVRLEHAPLINMGGVGVVEKLISGRKESRAQMIHTAAEPHAHGGEELYTISSDLEILHVARGSITLQFTSHEVELQSGDTLSFSGREPHTWSAHDEGAELVWTLIPAAWSGTA